VADNQCVSRVSSFLPLANGLSITNGDSGEERWRSDGIQVGGVRSQRGVIGTWFDKDFDAQGPAGPTAFWKISDNNLLDDDGDDELF
jgi:hypothetical protein